MKCPYQTITIHKPKSNYGYTITHAMDIVEFGECDGKECPFYDETKGCLKANNEVGRK